MLDTYGCKHTLRTCITFCFSTLTGSANAPQCYVLRITPVLLGLLEAYISILLDQNPEHMLTLDEMVDRDHYSKTL